ncbi:hypothetical protein AHAS_Ahas11G0273100 [Arachis hypogaea]
MEQQLLGYEHEMYRLDHVEHIAGRFDRVASQILRISRNLMTRPPEQIRPYMRRAGFEYVAYMVEFEHNWSLASVLIERIDSDLVSGYIGGWEQHHQGWTIEKLCEQILGVVPGPEDHRRIQ